MFSILFNSVHNRKCITELMNYNGKITKFTYVCKLYLHNYKKSVAWVVIQFAIFISAWYTALTRITDNMHHCTDVLAGSIIGTSFAVIMVNNIAKINKHNKMIKFHLI